MIKAINHPLRRRMLRLLIDRDEPLSPAQIARALDLPVGLITYHARILAHLGAVVRAGKKQVRGTSRRLYKTTIEDDPPVETLLDETQEVDEKPGKKGDRKGR